MASRGFPDYRREVLQYVSNTVANPPTSRNIAPRQIERVIWTKIGKLNMEVTTLMNMCRDEPDCDKKLDLFCALLIKSCRYIIESQQTYKTLSPEIQNHLWSNCINPCLDFLRNCSHLPANSLAFFNEASLTFTNLLDKVPECYIVWTKGLGDLYSTGQFIHELTKRNDYIGMGTLWYSLTSDIRPEEGDIYYSLARNSTNALQKHLRCSQAACAVNGSALAQGLLMELFKTDWQATFPHVSPRMFTLLEAHGNIFQNKTIEAKQSIQEFLDSIQEFLDFFTNKVEPTHPSIKEFPLPDLLNGEFSALLHTHTMGGSYVAITSIAAMFGFGSKENPLVQSLSTSKYIAETAGSPQFSLFLEAERLANEIFKNILERIIEHPDDSNLLSFTHCMLVFIKFIASRRPMDHITSNIPWPQLVEGLNALLTRDHVSYEDRGLPRQFELLLEDRLMRGQKWAHGYHDQNQWWFTDMLIKYDQHGAPSTKKLMNERKGRILALGDDIAGLGWIRKYGRRFSTVQVQLLATETGE